MPSSPRSKAASSRAWARIRIARATPPKAPRKPHASTRNRLLKKQAAGEINRSLPPPRLRPPSVKRDQAGPNGGLAATHPLKHDRLHLHLLGVSRKHFIQR